MFAFRALRDRDDQNSIWAFFTAERLLPIEGADWTLEWKSGVFPRKEDMKDMTELEKFTRMGIAPGLPADRTALIYLGLDDVVFVEEGEADQEYPKWYELPGGAALVFALWLRTLSSGPKWASMSREARIAVARRLYQDVASFSDELLASEKVHRHRQLPWEPSEELLKEVGIQPPTSALLRKSKED